MSIVSKVKEQIRQMPAGEVFTAASLRHLGKADTVRKALGRLVLAGKLNRVAHGVFTKPKADHVALPTAQEVVSAIAKQTGEKVAIHGAEAARQLQLTTQVPLQLVLYTTGKSRCLVIYNRTVRLQHISSRKLVAPGTLINVVISALWYLGRENVSEKTVRDIKEKIGQTKFDEVLNHIKFMPAWMANTFHHFQKTQHNNK